MSLPVLPLHTLADRHFALPTAVADCFLLQRVLHSTDTMSRRRLTLEDDGQAQRVGHLAANGDHRGKAAMANTDDATCQGASASPLLP